MHILCIYANLKELESDPNSQGLLPLILAWKIEFIGSTNPSAGMTRETRLRKTSLYDQFKLSLR